MSAVEPTQEQIDACMNEYRDPWVDMRVHRKIAYMMAKRDLRIAALESKLQLLIESQHRNRHAK